MADVMVTTAECYMIIGQHWPGWSSLTQRVTAHQSNTKALLVSIVILSAQN